MDGAALLLLAGVITAIATSIGAIAQLRHNAWVRRQTERPRPQIEVKIEGPQPKTERMVSASLHIRNPAPVSIVLKHVCLPRGVLFIVPDPGRDGPGRVRVMDLNVLVTAAGTKTAGHFVRITYIDQRRFFRSEMFKAVLRFRWGNHPSSDAEPFHMMAPR